MDKQLLPGFRIDARGIMRRVRHDAITDEERALVVAYFNDNADNRISVIAASLSIKFNRVDAIINDYLTKK